MIFHVDANSAYLSWTAVFMLEKGHPVDLRTIPSVISGNPDNRHGIILAKSIPAKGYGIKTGESLFEARRKCPNLTVIQPNYNLYLSCSDAMYNILLEYSPTAERYSIDECFLDMSRSQKLCGDPVKTAHEIRQRIKNELGFTVNIGVGNNRICAKMASEFTKPDKVHTLWPREIPEKMWPLPVSELFMVGRATKAKLEKINIRTVGDLANADPLHMKALMKSHGILVHQLANGIDGTPVTPNNEVVQKGVGNSITTPKDVTTLGEAWKVLLSLTERACQRMRRIGCICSLVSVHIKTNTFLHFSHQIQLPYYTGSTSEIYRCALNLLAGMWDCTQPLRQLGVRLGNLDRSRAVQLSLLQTVDPLKEEKVDQTVDSIRKRYGDSAIMRGCFADGSTPPIQGGVNDGQYINIGGGFLDEDNF